MGDLIITDTDFSFEWDSTENAAPAGSADIADQSVLQNLQHWSEAFYYDLALVENSTPTEEADIEKQIVLTFVQASGFDFVYNILPAGFADSYTVHTHTTTKITVSGTPFAGLDLVNKAVIVTSGALEDYFFYIVAYTDSYVKGSGIDLTSLVDDVDTFQIVVPAIVTEEDPTPASSADIADQTVLQNLQHWSEDFFYVLVTTIEKTFYLHVQDKVLRSLANAEITITDLDHPAVPPETIYTDKWGNTEFLATLLSRYRFDVVAENHKSFSFELGMLTSQPSEKSVKTLLQDFKSIIDTKEDEDPVE